MRTKCLDCTIKHLGQALVNYQELLAYPEFKVLVIGHLAEAEVECPDSIISAEIRKIRLSLDALNYETFNSAVFEIVSQLQPDNERTQA